MNKIDWEKIKTEYITSNKSIRALADKYGVNACTIAKHSKSEGWCKSRQQYANKVHTKVIQKTATKQANIMVKELDCLTLLEKHLNTALKDADQFNRFIVNVGLDGAFDSEERVFQKVDMRSLKDAAQTLKLLEQMKRSMNGILTPEQSEQLALAREKLELDKQRAAADADQQDHEVIVRFADDDAEGWAD